MKLKQNKHYNQSLKSFLYRNKETRRNGRYFRFFLLVFALITICGLFHSCKNVKLITICWETPRQVKNAVEKYPELTPLTMAELKVLLHSDTSHYKVVNILSPCCGPCTMHLQTTFRQYLTTVDTAGVRFYYISEDCGGLKHLKGHLNSYGYYLPHYYYIRDTSAAFRRDDEGNRLNNIAHYLFPNQPKPDNLLGIPVNFIVDKHGRVKQYYEIDTAGRQKLGTTPLWAIGNDRICDLDFNTIDTLYYTPGKELRYCTTKWCRMWKLEE